MYADVGRDASPQLVLAESHPTHLGGNSVRKNGCTLYAPAGLIRPAAVRFEAVPTQTVGSSW